MSNKLILDPKMQCKHYMDQLYKEPIPTGVEKQLMLAFYSGMIQSQLTMIAISGIEDEDQGVAALDKFREGTEQAARDLFLDPSRN